MSSEWQEYRLGDVTRWASGGTPSKQNPEYWGGSIPWISASSMKAKICVNSDERITEEAVRSGARMCDPGTILLLVRGSELHKRIPIGVATKRVAFNQDVKAINACSGDLSGDYLYYLLKGSEEFLLNSVEFTGIGAGKLETPFLQDLVFLLPTREEQAVITGFMIALDDKIELNRKTNETLEAMAKALFKSWFVDFDPVRAKAEGRPTGLPAEISDLFPDSFDDSELGEIPSGWRVMELGMVSTFLNGYAFKSSDWQEHGVPVVKIGSVKPGFVDVDNVSFVSDEIAVSKDRYRLSPGDILIGMTGYVGEVGLVPISESPPLLNQRVGRVAPMSDAIVSRSFLYNWMRTSTFKDSVEVLSHGSAQANVSSDSIQSIPHAIPSSDIERAFASICEPILDRLLEGHREQKLLANIRDALLPKLISGEIRIPDAEKMLDEVGI